MKTIHHAITGRFVLYAECGAAALAIATLSSPALAQDSSAEADISQVEEDEGRSATKSDVIVVTGSRIRQPEYSSVEPLTVITAEEITEAGFNSSTDALQSTAVTAGAAQINNYYAGFVTDGGTGVNTLGLRGLGPSRTLVLLDGRRLAPGGTRGAVLATDLNVLPTSIVDRIDVLKAGASSIYGSDAVAGVVNIITKDSLRGLDLQFQTNVPELGAGSSYRGAASFGFQANRLKVIGSLEYYKRKGLSRDKNPWFSCPIQGAIDGEGAPFGSGDYIDPATGEPKCFTLDNGGVTINTIGVGRRNSPDRLTGEIGRFNRLVPDASNTGPYTPGYSGVTFYTRDSFDPENEREYLVSPVQTYTGFISASYDLDMLGGSELYTQFLATRRKSSAHSYRQLSLDYPIYLNPDFTPTGRENPLVPDQFANSILAFPNEITGDGFLGVRAFIGFGLTDSIQSVDFVRWGGGVRGILPSSDWRYDIYAGKSWNDGTYEIESFLIDRLAASLDVVEQADGTIVCASQATNPNCVAAPPLTPATIGGDLPQNYRDWILANTVGVTKFRETTFAANIDGPLFKLPGGDVQAALGVEYRKQSINDQPDENSVNGNLRGLTASTPTVGSDSVREVYGELFLPIVSDTKFFEYLSLNASARYTDYESYGSGWTYKLASKWELFPGFSFRGSYGTSYRAPALAEQFLGSTSGFIGSGNDPCDSDGFPGDPAAYTPSQTIIAANCAAIGIDVTTFDQNSGITVLRRGGADTGLSAETSKNWTLGTVFRPQLPDSVGLLSLSADYFSIKVNNGVADISGGAILNRCYSETNFNPNAGFCRFVERNSNNILTVISSYVNLSEDIVKGWEFNGRFERKFGDGLLTLNASLTKYEEQSNKLFPEEFLADANGTYRQPDMVGTFDATYKIENIKFIYGLSWIDGDNNGRSYDFFAFDDTTGMVDDELAQSYRDRFVLHTKDYFLHKASIKFSVESFQMTVGVRNIFNIQPPKVTAVVSTIANFPLYSGYDYTGRTVFMNAGFNF